MVTAGLVTSATQLVALMDNVGELGPSQISITESEMIEAAEQAEREMREQRQMEYEQAQGRRMRDSQSLEDQHRGAIAGECSKYESDPGFDMLDLWGKHERWCYRFGQAGPVRAGRRGPGLMRLE